MVIKTTIYKEAYLMGTFITTMTSLVTVLISLLPVATAIAHLISAKTRSQRIKILADRAEVITRALDQQLNMSNENKLEVASNKLVEYSGEVGIKLTKEQASDYINATVNAIRSAANN